YSVSSIFQGQTNADGSVPVSLAAPGPNAVHFRGLLYDPDMPGYVAEEYLAQPIYWHMGVARTAAGALLIDSTLGAIEQAPGGLVANPTGILYASGVAVEVIHQGVGLTNLGELIGGSAPINLVNNGDFCADAAGWTEIPFAITTAYTTCTQVQLTALETSATSLHQTIAVTNGVTYRVKCDAQADAGNSGFNAARITLASADSNGELIYDGVSGNGTWQMMSFDWLSDRTSVVLRLELAADLGDDFWGSVGDIAYFRNVSMVAL
ncbi:MAG: hypothetical protein ACR2O5_06735, partial [Thiogranum sp.]